MVLDGRVFVGTSGWGYDEWLGPFYPKGLKPVDYLSYYSKVFFTSEINTTFYHIPSRWVVNNWAKKTPSNFVFAQASLINVSLLTRL